MSTIDVPLLRRARAHFLSSSSMSKFAEMDILLEFLKDPGSQESLLKITFNDDDVKKYPVKIAFQKSFLKKIISELEKENCEIKDELYDTYCCLLETEKSISLEPVQYHHFELTGDAKTRSKIIIKCDDNFLSGGTTGLSLWQAGFFLAEWSLENKHIFQGKNVLELGSGSGFTGLAVAAGCRAKSVCLTDGHDKVLEQLEDNVLLNCGPKEKGAEYKINNCSVSVTKLEWENASSAKILNHPNIILAADVVYDPSVFEALSKTLIYLLNREDAVAIMACTLRNEDTLKELFNKMSNDVIVTEEAIPTSEHFVYNREFEVLIYKLQLK